MSRAALAFSPSLDLKEIKEKSMTKIDVIARETAMKPGEDAGGAVRSEGALEGKAERSV